MKYFYTLLICITISCQQKDKTSKEINAVNLLDRVIEQHGGQTYFSKKIGFTINDTQYSIAYPKGRALYTMERNYNEIHNKVIYDGGYLKYYKNDSLQEDNSFPYRIIERSLYGTLYGLSIPFNLNNKEYSFSLLENVTIRSQNYYVLQATSPDLQEKKTNEVLLYVAQDDYTIDYLAIDYNAIALQKQFRRLTNDRKIDHILFQDVVIFVAQDSTLSLDKYYTHYNNPKLKHTKTIELKNIEVQNLD